MELLSVKIIALTLLGVFSLFFGLLPLRLRKVLAKGTKKRERIVSCLLCFGGGVLLATVFTHMLPETREGFASAAPDVTYPLAEVVICAGFFLIYFVEEFVHKVSDVTLSPGGGQVLKENKDKTNNNKKINKRWRKKQV